MEVNGFTVNFLRTNEACMWTANVEALVSALRPMSPSLAHKPASFGLKAQSLLLFKAEARGLLARSLGALGLKHGASAFKAKAHRPKARNEAETCEL